MPSPEHEAYRRGLVCWFQAHADEPDVAAQLERHRHAVLVLWELDLEAARASLRPCYAASPRGGDPWDPILVLRCHLLALLVGQPSINMWVSDLKASRVLRVLVGLPEGEWPGVGTLYDFLHRLHDGPIRGCEHVEKPSVAERRRAITPRAPQGQPKPAPAPKPARKGKKKPSKKQRKAERAAIVAPVADPSTTEKLVKELADAAALDNPFDLLARLAAILFEVGVAGSAARGLLGDTAKLVVGGDGSPLRTGASRNGKRTCECPVVVRCGCARIYADPDARIGYDSHRDCYFNGHHFYEVSTSVGGCDLPLAIRLDPGNTTDYTASLHTLDRLRNDIARHAPGMAIATFIADAGHDAEPIYRYCCGHGITPLIPLKTDAPAAHPKRPDLKLSKRGVPTCGAGAEMVPRGTAAAGRPIFACPVRNGKLECCPIAPPDKPDWLCRPELKCGPTATVKVDDNPRLCPPIPRNHPRHAELMKLRTGCERSNSVKKETFKLEDARHRRASFWLMRLHFIAVLQHARAWVDDGAARGLVDHLLGREPIAKRA